MKTVFKLLACICFLLSSCVSYRYIDIQVLNPASIKIPSKITRLYIVDGTKKLDTVDYTKDSVTVNLSNLPLESFGSTLKSKLEQTLLFKRTSILVRNTQQIRNDLKNKTIAERKSIAVVYVRYRIVVDTSQLDNYYSDYYGNYIFYTLFKLELSNIGTNEVYDSYKPGDTLVWARTRERGIPSKALLEVGRIAAEKYARRIAPYWKTEERVLFYKGNRAMRKGYELFEQNNLEGAMASWKHLYDIGTRPLAGAAAYNIALIYEMLDDLDSCEAWLVKSIASKKYELSAKYLELIQKRKLNNASIDKQIQP
jgi:hypothetical protein